MLLFVEDTEGNLWVTSYRFGLATTFHCGVEDVVAIHHIVHDRHSRAVVLAVESENGCSMRTNKGGCVALGPYISLLSRTFLEAFPSGVLV